MLCCDVEDSRRSAGPRDRAVTADTVESVAESAAERGVNSTVEVAVTDDVGPWWNWDEAGGWVVLWLLAELELLRLL